MIDIKIYGNIERYYLLVIDLWLLIISQVRLC